MLLALIGGLLAAEPTSNLSAGTLPQLSASARQIESPLAQGARLHMTRLSVELASPQRRHFELAGRARVSSVGLAVPSEDHRSRSTGHVVGEVWAIARPGERTAIALLGGVGSRYEATGTNAFYVLPYETASSGGHGGLHVAHVRDRWEVQQTILSHSGFFVPSFVLSQTSAGLRHEQGQLIGTASLSTHGHHVGVTVRAQPKPLLDIGLGLSVPLGAISEERSAPIDVGLELRVQKPREDAIAPRDWRNATQSGG